MNADGDWAVEATGDRPCRGHGTPCPYGSNNKPGRSQVLRTPTKWVRFIIARGKRSATPGKDAKEPYPEVGRPPPHAQATTGTALRLHRKFICVICVICGCSLLSREGVLLLLHAQQHRVLFLHIKLEPFCVRRNPLTGQQIEHVAGFGQINQLPTTLRGMKTYDAAVGEEAVIR